MHYLVVSAMEGGLLSPPLDKNISNPTSNDPDQLDLKNQLTFDYAHGANKVPKRQVTEDDSG